MKFHIQSYNNFEITDTIHQFAIDKFSALQKFIHDDTVNCFVTLGRITNHHKQGEVYKVSIQVKTARDTFQAEEINEDLYAAIDILKDTIERSIVTGSQKKRSIFKKAALKFKDLIKR